MESVPEELKQELSKLGPRGRGRAYPTGLLEKLLSYTVARRRQGAKIVEVATELGMKFLHALALARREAINEALRARGGRRGNAVCACADRARPGGLRAEGLDLARLAALVRRVAE